MGIGIFSGAIYIRIIVFFIAEIILIVAAVKFVMWMCNDDLKGREGLVLAGKLMIVYYLLYGIIDLALPAAPSAGGASNR